MPDASGLAPRVSAAGGAATALIGRRPRLAAAVLVVLCVGIGAAVGAGTHPGSELFRAQAQMSVTATAPAFQPIAWNTARDAIAIPAVRERVTALTNETRSSVRLGTKGNPDSALITIYADARTAELAQLVANSAAAAAVNFLKENLAGSVTAHFTFDRSAEGWDLGSGIYVLPPGTSRVVAAPAHGGTGSLEAICQTTVVGGCGPYLRLERPFLQGRVYEAAGWVKARPATRLRLVIGATPHDVAVGETVRAGGAWRHLAVQWKPERAAGLAVMAVQIMSRGGSALQVDDFEVGPAQGKPGAAVPGPQARYETVVPATSAALLEGADTGAWAAGGAAAGLVIAAIALAAVGAAARRRDSLDSGHAP